MDYIDSTIFEGNTTLHMASSKDHLPFVQYLIEKGPNIEAKNENQQTPLHIACQYNHRSLYNPKINWRIEISTYDFI